jgi:hypothetical protein
MKKVESVLDGSLGWRKTRPLATFPQILFGPLSLILAKKFTMKGEEEGTGSSHPHVETLFKRLIRSYLTIRSKIKGEKNEKKPHYIFHLLALYGH